MRPHVRIREAKTCTGEKAYWLLPNALVDVPYKPIKELDFTSSKTQKKKLDQQIDKHCLAPFQIVSTERVSKKNNVPKPSDFELEDFFQKISKCGSKPAVLSLVNPFSDAYVPRDFNEEFSPLISDFVDTSCFNLPYDELLVKCREVKSSINVSKEQSLIAEKETHNQSQSNKWFKLRSGRITASRLHAVLHTNSSKPSQSLIKQLCYPEAFKFTSKATCWGCEHEKTAQELYVKSMSSCHENFQIRDSGVVISSDYPYLGASPDGIVSCSCCGIGVNEIKCPYCKRDNSINEAVEDKKFCVQSVSGKLALDRNHAYYYQMQQQLQICKEVLDCQYGDFVVWTEKEIFIERILPDNKFWEDNIPRLDYFFETCILPEIIGNYYTNLGSPPAQALQECQTKQDKGNHHSNLPASKPDELWCICRGQETSKMVLM